ncbi:MAG: hypothetical protein D4R73_01505 [Deltaproteobacteria bacterium]|nr:MAG: hypothetical protein D4R73_01505 [Deltaproteobacteria bacterium]
MPTYYLSNADLVALALEELATSAPASLEEAQGWTVDKKASPSYKEYIPDTINAAATFVTTEPSSFTRKGYRTAAALNGIFANANWVLYFKVKSNTYYAQTGYIKFRLWRSANADGSAAVELTPGWQTSGLISFTAANQYMTGAITWSPGATKLLTAEYLFLEIEWSAVASGGNNAAAVAWVHNEGAAEKLVTPALTSSYSESVSLGSASGISDNRISGMVPAASLPGAAALIPSGIKNGFGAAALAGEAALIPAGGLSYVSPIAFPVSTAITEAADLAALKEMGLVCQAGISLGAALSIQASMSLSGNASVGEGSGGSGLFPDLGIPGAGALYGEGIVAMVRSLGLAGLAGLPVAARDDLLTSMGLPGTTALDQAASLLAEQALALAGLGALNADGTIETGAGGEYQESISLGAVAAAVKIALLALLASQTLPGAGGISTGAIVQATAGAVLAASGHLTPAQILARLGSVSFSAISGLAAAAGDYERRRGMKTLTSMVGVSFRRIATHKKDFCIRGIKPVI